LYGFRHSRHLHSFPTRRSSDLTLEVQHGAKPIGGGLRFDGAGKRLRRGAVGQRLCHHPPDQGALWLLCEAEELGATAAKLLGLRSEEHTSELQSQSNLVCRLLL